MQAVIRTLQEDELKRGCLMEERVLKGELKYESSMPRLIGDEERFVLLAMHQTLVERGLCMRQPTGKGNLLVFPSYYRRGKAGTGGASGGTGELSFTGFLDEIYVIFRVADRVSVLRGGSKVGTVVKSETTIDEVSKMIIGGGEHSQREIEQLRKLAHNLEVRSSVDFLGLIKHEDLPYFYSAADACVVPSYYESFGLVALESLACGTPVVATDVGHHKSLIRQGDTGYVIKDNDPRCLADRIALLLSRSESNTKSAQAIRGTVNKFRWSNVAEAIARDCRLVLAKHVVPVS